MRGALQRVRGPKAGRASSERSHSSGGGAKTGRCQSFRQHASRCRSCAAGPPRRAVSHVRDPTCTSAPSGFSRAAGSGTSPGAGGAPARIHL
eukprot:3381692-Lingulodinium_polyedra.AAC.1